MSVTVNPQYPVTGKILGACTVQEEEEADVGVFVDLETQQAHRSEQKYQGQPKLQVLTFQV